MSVPLVHRNLWHHKGKLTLHVLGIAASLALIGILFGFREGMYRSVSAYTDNVDADLIIAQEGVDGFFSSRSAIPKALHDDILSVSNANGMDHILVSSIIFTYKGTKTPVLLIGYNTATGIGGPWDIGQGRTVWQDDEILVDRWLADRADIELGDEIAVFGHRFTVVGLTRGTSSWMSPYVFVSQTAAEKATGLADVVSYYLLQLPTEASVAQSASELEGNFDHVDALIPEELAAADRQVLATTMETPLNAILAIGFVIGVAVMGLTSYTALMDRIHEYGVLKAVGGGRGWLRWLVVRETVYRTGLGYAAGVALSYLASSLMVRVWPQFLIVIEWRTVLALGGLALVMTVAAAMLPLQRVARVDPALVFKA